VCKFNDMVSYKGTVDILQEIERTFLKSVNGSSFPVIYYIDVTRPLKDAVSCEYYKGNKHKV